MESKIRLFGQKTEESTTANSAQKSNIRRTEWCPSELAAKEITVALAQGVKDSYHGW